MKVLLTVALMIGLVASAAKPFNPQNLLPGMGLAHNTHVKTMMKSFKSRLRGFDAQQAEYLVPVSDAEICKGTNFVSEVTKVYTLCSVGSVAPLLNQSIPSTLEGIRNAWETYCNGACVSAAAALLDTYAVCIHPYLKLQGMSWQYLCSSRDPAGDRCGVTLSKFGEVVKCEERSYLSCYDSEFCTWISGSESSECQASYTQTVLSSLCGSCAMGFAELNNQSPKYGSSDISDGLNQFCLRAPSGAYCLPTLQTAAQVSAASLGEALQRICGNNDLYYCYRTTAERRSAASISDARREFVECAARYRNVTASVNRNCFPKFESTLSDERSSFSVIVASDHTCLKNSKGALCSASWLSFFSDDCVWDTYFGHCKSPCPATVANLVSNLGCCIGMFQQILTTPKISLDDIPYIPGYVPTLTPPPPAAPGTTAPVVLGSGEELIPNPVDGGMYDDVALCNVSGFNQTLRKRCVVPTAQTAGSILVPMAYSEINANAGRKMRVKASLRFDIAAAAGVPVNAIVNDDIVENSTVKVATSSARRQTTANGCEYKYTIQALTTAYAKLAASNVYSAAASGRVPLTNTQALLSSECASTCAGTAGVNSISQVKPGVVSTFEFTSSSFVASTCLSIALAILLSLL
jgi:hypothetical protein